MRIFALLSVCTFLSLSAAARAADLTLTIEPTHSLVELHTPAAAPAEHGAAFWEREKIVEDLLIADWAQTRGMAAGGWFRTHETNPILGRHPSSRAVDLYFAGTVIAHPIIAAILPDAAGSVWQVLTSAVEIKCIAGNAALGAGLDGPHKSAAAPRIAAQIKLF